MDLKKFLIGTVAGGIMMFLAGWILYGILLMKFFQENSGSATGVMKADDEMIWWALILGNLALGGLLTYIYLRWASIKTLTTGAMAGAMVGLFMGMGGGFISFATTNLGTTTSTIVDILVMVVMMGLGGGAVGAALGMVKD